MPSEARQKKLAKNEIGPQNGQLWGLKTWGQGGARAPGAPPGSASAEYIDGEFGWHRTIVRPNTCGDPNRKN